MRTEWKRVDRKNKCPICGKDRWCLISHDRSAVICPRTEEKSEKYIEGSGYLHIIGERKSMPKGGVVFKEKPLPEHNQVIAEFARKFYTLCGDEKTKVVSENLGVSGESLRRLGMGWQDSSSAATFPMFRQGKRVIGLRFQCLLGKKWALKGSKMGLFIPVDVGYADGRPLYVCEGASDTAALLDLGLTAIGRPSCLTGTRLIKEFSEGYKKIVIFADNDEVGIDGAKKLLSVLRAPGVDVRAISAPNAKDAREWISGGATRMDVTRLVDDPLVL